MDRPQHINFLHVQHSHSETNPFSRPTTPGHHDLQIGFCGLGAMGSPMVTNLAKSLKQHTQAPLPVMIWNRTQNKADDLAKQLGDELVTVADSLDQIATECDIIFTNLSNDDVVRSVYKQFAKALQVRLEY